MIRPTRVARAVALTAGLLVALIPAAPAVHAATPSNDAFGSATVIGALPSTTTVDLQSATTEPGEPRCGGSMFRTAWYSLHVDTDTTIRIRGAGSFFTRIGVYRVDAPGFDGLTALTCPTFQYPTLAVVHLAAGNTYMIQVGDWSDEGSVVDLSLTVLTPPANDQFAAASAVASLPFVDPGVEISAATTEAGEPASCLGQERPRTVWYRYHPSADGSVTMYADGNGNAAITAFGGTSLDGLESLGCHYNRATLGVKAGETYEFQVDGLSFDDSAWTVRLETTPPVQVSVVVDPPEPSTFDTPTIYGQINDPVGQDVASETWSFGDGSTGSGSAPTHRYAVDGDYQVRLELTTVDGRTAKAAATVHVRTHDVAIRKLAVPKSASTGQTRSVTVSLANTRYPETALVRLYRSAPGGFVEIGEQTGSVPVRAGNRTTDFTFSYTFTSADALVGSVTFQATVELQGAREAIPADNEAVSLATKVSR
jgi:hypothetical protein